MMQILDFTQPAISHAERPLTDDKDGHAARLRFPVIDELAKQGIFAPLSFQRSPEYPDRMRERIWNGPIRDINCDDIDEIIPEPEFTDVPWRVKAKKYRRQLLRVNCRIILKNINSDHVTYMILKRRDTNTKGKTTQNLACLEIVPIYNANNPQFDVFGWPPFILEIPSKQTGLRQPRNTRQSKQLDKNRGNNKSRDTSASTSHQKFPNIKNQLIIWQESPDLEFPDHKDAQHIPSQNAESSRQTHLPVIDASLFDNMFYMPTLPPFTY